MTLVNGASLIKDGASLNDVVEEIRPFYDLGNRHGYRDALEDLLEGVSIGEFRSMADVVAFARIYLKENYGA